MKLSEFDYDLPYELIAQNPTERRDQSRLLVLDKKTGAVKARRFSDITEYLSGGDVLVLNNTKVFPARLLGRKEKTLGKVEIFLNKEVSPGNWQCMGKKLKAGDRVIFDNSDLFCEITKKDGQIVEATFNMSGEVFFSEVEKIGHIPLPPYIKRDSEKKNDKERYQTIFAKERGSVAAPTAGLHFTDKLLSKIRLRGVEIVEVTLHVGLGTFKPIETENIEEHQIHSEFFSVKKDVLEKIIKAKKERRRIIAVGTTTTRVLEHLFSSVDYPLTTNDYSGWTDIYIYPGYKFRCVDCLITNFHLPKSSLLLLVSALAGSKNIQNAYKIAVEKKFRFFSYGDAMFIK